MSKESDEVSGGITDKLVRAESEIRAIRRRIDDRIAAEARFERQMLFLAFLAACLISVALKFG